MNISGTLIWYYFVCKREVWFMARELTPDQDNSFIEIGRMIEENFYKRENKGLDLGNIKIDLVKKDGEDILIGEVKKSSKFEKPSIMQLSFYLLKLRENGIDANGEVLVPKERKKIPVKLNKELEEELKVATEEIEKIIMSDTPPKKEKSRFCTNCAYREFCWS
ncbi:MAG: CRISPR-associated protein Cas4 [Caldisericaceae bacterium]